MAGVAWALTLVNLHEPEVVAGVLEGAEEALERLHPELRERGAPGTIFRVYRGGTNHE